MIKEYIIVTRIEFCMREWIISVVCVIVLGVLIEIVLPSGKITKYVKGTFALVVIFVIVAPLPRLLKSEWTFEFSTAWQNANATFEEETALSYLDEKALELKNFLSVNGYECEVTLENGAGAFDIGKATIVLFGDGESADVVRDMVSKRLAIDKSRVQLIVKKCYSQGAQGA